jgi:tetratricopeptide (TPR) repeat protein
MFKDTDPDLYEGEELTVKTLLENGSKRAASALTKTPELQAELLMGIGRAQRDVDDFVAADKTVAQAADIYQKLKNDRQYVLALLYQADIALALGQNDNAQALHDKAQALAKPFERDSLIAGRLAEIQGFVALFRRDVALAKTAFKRYLAEAMTRTDDPPKDLVNVLLGLADATSKGSGDFGGAMASIQQAFEIVREWPGVPASMHMSVVNYRQSIEYDWGRFADIVQSSQRDLEGCGSPQTLNDCVQIKTRLQKALLKMGFAARALAMALNPGRAAAAPPPSPRDQALALMDLARSLAWSA